MLANQAALAANCIGLLYNLVLPRLVDPHVHLDKATEKFVDFEFNGFKLTFKQIDFPPENEESVKEKENSLNPFANFFSNKATSAPFVVINVGNNAENCSGVIGGVLRELVKLMTISYLLYQNLEF